MVDVVLNPIETHVYGFGSLDFSGVIGKALCCGVVGDDACWSWLWMSKFGEDVLDVGAFLSIDEKHAGFCFKCRGHDVEHYAAFNVYWPVWLGGVGTFLCASQVVAATCS